MTNDELAQTMDTNDEWIQARVGIAERRWAEPDETLVEMSVAAGGKALAASGLDAADIDLVLLATTSPPTAIPGLAPRVAHQLGIPAPGRLRPQRRLRRLVLRAQRGGRRDPRRLGAQRPRHRRRAADRLHRPDDRATAVIFADGAGAAVVGPSDEPAIGPVVWGSDGDLHEAIAIPVGETGMSMAGQAVYRWATTKLTDTLDEAMRRAGVGPDDIDVFAPHQANLRIIELMAKRLEAARAHGHRPRHRPRRATRRRPRCPLALSALLESGEAKTGDLALLLGYGAGLTFAGQVVVLP